MAAEQMCGCVDVWVTNHFGSGHLGNTAFEDTRMADCDNVVVEEKKVYMHDC